MSVIQKVESAYLQLLRILFLLFATGAIVIAAILGARYLMQHDARPEPIQENIKLSFDTYKPAQRASSAETNGADGVKPVAASGSKKDVLLENFHAVIEQMGKKTRGDFVINRAPVVDFFKEMERDPNLGRPFIEQLIDMLKMAQDKKEIADRLKQDFAEELFAIIDHFKAEYRQQRTGIETKKAVAASAAQAQQADAVWSLYAAGVLCLAFVGLILLTVLLKIERNLRGGLPAKA